MDIRKIVETNELYNEKYAQIHMDVLVFQFKIVRAIMLDPRFKADSDPEGIVPDKSLEQSFIASLFSVSRYLFTRKDTYQSFQSIANQYFDYKHYNKEKRNLLWNKLFAIYDEGDGDYQTLSSPDFSLSYNQNHYGILAYYYLTSLTKKLGKQPTLNDTLRKQISVIYLIDKEISEFNWRVPFNDVLGYDRFSNMITEFITSSHRTYGELTDFIRQNITEENIGAHYYS